MKNAGLLIVLGVGAFMVYVLSQPSRTAPTWVQDILNPIFGKGGIDGLNGSGWSA